MPFLRRECEIGHGEGGVEWAQARTGWDFCLLCASASLWLFLPVLRNVKGWKGFLPAAGMRAHAESAEVEPGNH